MSDTVIKVENLSKQYRLGTVGTGTLSHDLNRWWCRLRGKPDPYLKVTETNIRDQKAESGRRTPMWEARSARRSLLPSPQSGRRIPSRDREGAGMTGNR